MLLVRSFSWPSALDLGVDRLLGCVCKGSLGPNPTTENARVVAEVSGARQVR